MSIWIDGFDKQGEMGEAQLSAPFYLCLHQLSCDATPAIFGQDGQRIDVIFASLRLVFGMFEIHVIIWFVIECGKEGKSPQSDFVIVIPVVGQTKSQWLVVFPSDEGMSVTI